MVMHCCVALPAGTRRADILTFTSHTGGLNLQPCEFERPRPCNKTAIGAFQRFINTKVTALANTDDILICSNTSQPPPYRRSNHPPSILSFRHPRYRRHSHPVSSSTASPPLPRPFFFCVRAPLVLLATLNFSRRDSQALRGALY
jgi:hypothetical protein